MDHLTLEGHNIWAYLEIGSNNDNSHNNIKQLANITSISHIEDLESIYDILKIQNGCKNRIWPYFLLKIGQMLSLFQINFRLWESAAQFNLINWGYF